jgi:hypothetical protein
MRVDDVAGNMCRSVDRTSFFFWTMRARSFSSDTIMPRIRRVAVRQGH